MIAALSGVVGTGGGVRIVPALVLFFHMDQHRAHGTSLGALLEPIGLLAFWEVLQGRKCGPARRTDGCAGVLPWAATSAATGPSTFPSWCSILGAVMVVVGAKLAFAAK
jgi:uncharacterized membrane protein YfcA